MINVTIKLLDHFKNALILSHKYILVKFVVRYIKDCTVQVQCKYSANEL